MHTNDLRTLKILEEIDRGAAMTQRDLAVKLDVSLGLVNSFVKRLVQKGYFKVTTIPKNRIRYILTTKGASEKTRLTYQYIQHSFQFYRESRRKLRKLFEELADGGVRTIVFYGLTDFAEIAYISLHETDISLTAVIDTAPDGKKLFHIATEPPERLSSYEFDRILITDFQQREQIMKDLLTRGIPRPKIAAWE